MWRWKNYVIFEAGALHFRFVGEYSKLYRVKMMGTRGKINAIDEKLR